jgi:hypothetical protein
VRLCLILFLTSCAGIAQSIAVGVLGGGRLTDDVTSPTTPESRFYDVGASVELGLPHKFAVEVDAIYHRQGFLGGTSNPFGSLTESERANSWEFPILAKYKLPFKAFVEAGVAPRGIFGRVTDYGQFENIPTGGVTFSTSVSKTKWPGSLGIVSGGGIRLGVGRLRLSPEVRYTWWVNTPINEFTMTDGQPLQSSRNQVDLLLGISWKIR